MSIKNNSIKNLIDSHSWLGLIISLLLFLVFWAGSVSLFRAEIQNWSLLPHHPIDVSAEDIPLMNILDDVLEQYPLNNKEHLSINLPRHDKPYHYISIDLLSEEGYEGPEKIAEIKVNPKTGKIFDEADGFYLGSFIYALHTSLNWPPVGTYLIGFITLFFLFAIISGIFIHAKKIFKNFFTYRKDRKRTKLLDLHNVIGVMSLPFTIMFAITGLIFNLIIIYQIAFALFLYEGDQQALLDDAGYAIYQVQEQTGIPQDMSPSIALLESVEETYGEALYIRFHHYGDLNAVLEIGGNDKRYFGQGYEFFIQVRDGKILSQEVNGDYNALSRGLEVIVDLHFGSFAGIDLRFLYFALGLAVAGMIAIGNILWINKRATQKNISTKVTKFVGHLTVGSCSGFVVATAVAFLAERVMPELLANRPPVLIIIYSLSLALVTLSAFSTSNHKGFIVNMLYLTAGLLCITVAADWIMFSDALIILWKGGIHSIVGIEIGLLIFSFLCLFTTRLMRPSTVKVSSSFLETEIEPA